MGPDTHQPFGHPATDAEGKFSKDPGLNIAGQRDRPLAILNPHRFNANERRRLGRYFAPIVASRERDSDEQQTSDS